MIKTLEEDRIGWKSILSMRLSKDHKSLYIKSRLIKLLIPKGTTCNITNDKCRAEKAKILEIYDIEIPALLENMREIIDLERKYPMRTGDYPLNNGNGITFTFMVDDGEERMFIDKSLYIASKPSIHKSIKHTITVHDECTNQECKHVAIYKLGRYVYPDKFAYNDCECTSGIHFFEFEESAIRHMSRLLANGIYHILINGDRLSTPNIPDNILYE